MPRVREALRAASLVVKFKLFELGPARGQTPYSSTRLLFITKCLATFLSLFDFVSCRPLPRILVMPPKHRDGDVVAVVRVPRPVSRALADTRVDSRIMGVVGSYCISVHRIHWLVDRWGFPSLLQDRAERALGLPARMVSLRQLHDW